MREGNKQITGVFSEACWFTDSLLFNPEAQQIVNYPLELSLAP